MTLQPRPVAINAQLAPTATPTPAGPVTINYTYDPLGRLTAADYSNGDYYHYTYDAVGNRLTQQTQSGATNYTYDITNRLTNVNGVDYTWDNNGNLLNDGVNEYSYDAANRLTAVSSQQSAFSYGYNGLGDRLQQTVNSEITNYTLDLNAGLTQVLDDGTDTYLYGVDRIAQVNGANTDYFLGDALNSVRQLTDAGGIVTMAKAYDPYGVTAQTIGTSQTSYGFTGEATDSYIKLIYLRSRMYDPATGRFLTKDSWQGDYNRPASYHAWLYVYANPINLTDPSGHDPWWCEGGQYNEDICYVRWIVANGGRLTSDIVRSIYWKYPDETLDLLQQEFSIRIPTEYHFRFAFSADWDPGTLGASIWFAESNLQSGSIFELSQNQCALYSTENPATAAHIDYSIYITKRAFTDYDFYPDDVAGVMIHEAVHAWQENVARQNLGILARVGTVDVRSIEWFQRYRKGFERQAIDIMFDAYHQGRIEISNKFKNSQLNYRKTNAGGLDSPIQIPVGMP